ncbi:recombinase family protein [Nocardiopsis tropica]|uniref:Recombinase family protein n=1 Tax=Nocardiopsis tropica TaxID=109330 RepID=A0ABU7L218_9ACTN|nr:recombinase family protein [Nocardiopsis umidischolae]MEE2055607.1 recombinase family protein [Nocardiopsis umidischolae]
MSTALAIPDDPLAHSLQELIILVGDLRRAGVGFRSRHTALDTTAPGGRLVFQVFAALAGSIRELIVEGTARAWLRPARQAPASAVRPPGRTPGELSGRAVAPFGLTWFAPPARAVGPVTPSGVSRQMRQSPGSTTPLLSGAHRQELDSQFTSGNFV